MTKHFVNAIITTLSLELVLITYTVFGTLTGNIIDYEYALLLLYSTCCVGIVVTGTAIISLNVF
mgnify:CR=1 FL=1